MAVKASRLRHEKSLSVQKVGDAINRVSKIIFCLACHRRHRLFDFLKGLLDYIPNESQSEALTPEDAYFRLKQLVKQ